ncbi:hypothetical protein TNCV_3061371 [Trichonephila clavipes]|nr:hypothetical protein TNCV_3061371 [Trichonephila clavipes]
MTLVVTSSGLTTMVVALIESDDCGFHVKRYPDRSEGYLLRNSARVTNEVAHMRSTEPVTYGFLHQSLKRYDFYQRIETGDEKRIHFENPKWNKSWYNSQSQTLLDYGLYLVGDCK